jgi:hypothetical protein
MVMPFPFPPPPLITMIFPSFAISFRLRNSAPSASHTSYVAAYDSTTHSRLEKRGYAAIT